MEETVQPGEGSGMDGTSKAGIAIVGAVLLVAIFVAISNGNKKEASPLDAILNTTSTTSTAGEQTNNQPTTQMDNATELKIEDTQVGTGAEAKTGSKVAVHYRGMLTSGSVFDESYKRGQPIEITLGAQQVIEGWEKGIPGMKVGGKRTLTIPPAMGYGPNGYPPIIPGNATLIFEVELVSVQ